MKFAILASIASVVLADTPPTDANLLAVFNKHNDYRTTTAVSPRAVSMPKLQWSKTLATVAANYAAKCIWDHNDARTTQHKALSSAFSSVGENLAVRSGTSKSGAVQGVIDWWAEKSFFTYSTGACKSGEMCGHYTQMAWAKTSHVGCGISLCKTMRGIDWCTKYGGCVSLVCNYGNAGNMKINGVMQKPYEKVSGDQVEDPVVPVVPADLTNCKTTSGAACIAVPSGFAMDSENACFNMNEQGLFCFTGEKTTAGSYKLSRCSSTTCPSSYDKMAPASLSTNAQEVLDVNAPIAPVLSELTAEADAEASGAVAPLAFLALPAVVVASYL